MGIDTISQELDRLYKYEVDKYIAECDHWKKMGYKIYRNSSGVHKVVEPVKTSFSMNDFNDVFGDIFGGRL